MTKANYTHLSLVVDRSGSMMNIASDAEGGINSLIKEQSQGPGDITVSLYQFDTTYEKVFGPIDAKDAPTYNLHPRGATALLDATSRAISETGTYLRDMPEDQRPSKVVFVVVTDGHENASKEITRDAVKSMIKTQTDKYDWEFIYLGANLDAAKESSSIGIANSVQYHSTGASTSNMYAGVSRSLLNSRTFDVSVNSTLASEYKEDGQEK